MKQRPPRSTARFSSSSLSQIVSTIVMPRRSPCLLVLLLLLLLFAGAARAAREDEAVTLHSHDGLSLGATLTLPHGRAAAAAAAAAGSPCVVLVAGSGAQNQDACFSVSGYHFAPLKDIADFLPFPTLRYDKRSCSAGATACVDATPEIASAAAIIMATRGILEASVASIWHRASADR